VRVRDPQRSHGMLSTAPASHEPMSVQALGVPQVQLSRQISTRTPQRAHGDSRRSPGAHTHASHVPEMQRPPAAHGAAPGQHDAPIPPHPSQLPASHVSPALQPSPSQHGSPERPQVRQVPDSHTKIPMHAAPLVQQGPSADPQPVIGASMRASIRASGRGASSPAASASSNAASRTRGSIVA
jgi:hypothetical protein